jgi:hypothetical protein
MLDTTGIKAPRSKENFCLNYEYMRKEKGRKTNLRNLGLGIRNRNA